MTITLILALMMQFVVATKAGLVNFVQGFTSVKATELVPEGTPIRTGPNGYVELLLTPGSFLRMAPNSEAVLDSVDLSKVAVRILQGVANVEVVELNSYPIQVTTGNLKVEITSTGIYRFGDGLATVIEGKIQTADSQISYKKGWQLSHSINYKARRVSDTELSALDIFSKTRSELMASANMSLAPVVSRTAYQSSAPYWLFYPALGAYTYMPLRNSRSPYGFNYRGVESTYVTRNNGGEGGSSGSVASSPNGRPADSGSRDSGSFNSSGERTISTPSGGRMTPGEYQGSKSTTVPAKVPTP